MPVYGIYRMILEVVGHDQTGGLFRRISSGFASIMQYATAIVGAMVFERIASGIAGIVSQSIEAVAYMQQMDVALTQLSARELVQSGAAASIADAWERASAMGDKLLIRLQDMAILSPYTVESVTQTYRMAVAFGYTTDEAMTFTDALLENAAGIGADNSMLDRMAYNLAQVRLQGKVTALDIRQLALAGFDLNSVLRYVGKQMGIEIKTHLEFNEAIKSGKITWADFTKYYKQYADENFGGASERMARTLQGLKSTFHDVFVLTVPMMFGPAAQVITDFLNGILNKFIAFRKSGQLEAWGKDIEAWIKRALWSFQNLFNKEFSRKFRVANLIDMFFPKVEDPLKAADSLIKVWDVIVGVWDWGVGVVTNIGKNLQFVWEMLTLFWKQNGQEIIGVVQQVIASFTGEATGKQPTWIDTLFKPLKDFSVWLVRNGPAITDIIGKIGNFFSDVFFPAVSKVITFLANNWSTILIFFTVFKSSIGIMYGVSQAITAVRIAIALLANPFLAVAGLVALFAVAWKNDWGGIQEKVGAVWAWLQPILEENIPIAIQTLSNFWTTTLLPAITTVWTWISTVFIPFIAGTLIPWLQINIPTAIAQLMVWWNNLRNSLMTVWTYISTYILPIFSGVASLLGTIVQGAILGFLFLWNLIQPSLAVVWSFFQDNILPILATVGNFLLTVLGGAVTAAAGFFTNTLVPALAGFWTIVQENVIPIVKTAWDILLKLAGIVGTVAGAILDKLMGPIGSLVGIVRDYLVPIFTTLTDFVNKSLGPAIQWLGNGVFTPLADTLQGGLKKALEWFHDILLKIKDFLDSFELPAWLQQGSPTPFEYSLMGINDRLWEMSKGSLPSVKSALSRLNAMGMPSMEGEFGNVEGYGGRGGGVYVTVNVESLSNNMDVDRLAYKVARTIQKKRSYGE